MVKDLDIEARWPGLLEALAAGERPAVVQLLDSGWREGRAPNREDVENLTDLDVLGADSVMREPGRSTGT